MPGELPRALVLILGTGIGVAWGSRLLMDALGKLLKVQWNTGNIDGIMFIVSLTLAFAALPARAFAKKISNRKAMLSSISVIIIIMVIMLSLGAHLPIVFLGVCAFSLILNGAIPFALMLYHLVGKDWELECILVGLLSQGVHLGWCSHNRKQ